MRAKVDRQGLGCNAGYTLIELMITVAILAVLAGLAYKSYLKTVMRSNRADAYNALLADAQTLERCYPAAYSYMNSGGTGPCGTITFPLNSPSNYYSISATTLTANSYVLTATPNSGTAQTNDTQCIQFTLSNTGAKTATAQGGATNTTSCWASH